MAFDGTNFIPLTTGRSGRGKSFQAERKHVFPSEASLRWFVRTHKSKLVDAGAIVMLRGIWHADAQVFDDVLPKLLRADAQAKLTAE